MGASVAGDLPVASADATGPTPTEVDIRFLARRRRHHPGRDRAPRAGSGSGDTGDAVARTGTWPDGRRVLPHFQHADRERRPMMAAGTKEDPWVLKTPPGTLGVHDVQRRGGRSAGPGVPGGLHHLEVPASGPSTTCTPGWWSRATGSCSAPPTRRSPPRPAPSRRGDGRRTTPSAVGTACATATGAGSGCTCRPLLEALGLAEVTHEPRNNKMRAI